MSKSKMLRVEQQQQMKRIALYRRVSTDRQADEGFSLEIQRKKLLAYTETMDQVVSVTDYVDDGFSGGSLERPQLQKMIRDITAGIITHVIVVKLDRLSRSQKDTLFLLEDVFFPHNVALISVLENFDFSSSFGRASIGILSVFAQLERETIYERTRSGMLARVAGGKWPGGANTPYCYDYDRESGKLVPNDRAPLLKCAAERFLSGQSTYTIARELRIAEKTVYNMLVSLTNCGYIVYNGVEYPDCHEPILSMETHRAILAEMERRRSTKTVSESQHLLTGLVYCGKCDAKMRYMKWGKAGYCLYCYSQQPSKAALVRDESCDNIHPRAEEVEAAVVQTMFTVAKGDLSAAKKLVESDGGAQLLRDRLEKAKQRLKRLYQLYAEGGDEVLYDSIDKARAEVNELEEAVNDAARRDQRVSGALSAIGRLERLEDFWPHMTLAERRTVLASIVDRIEITDGQINVILKYQMDAAIAS